MLPGERTTGACVSVWNILFCFGKTFPLSRQSMRVRGLLPDGGHTALSAVRSSAGAVWRLPAQAAGQSCFPARCSARIAPRGGCEIDFRHMPWLAARASGLPKIVFRDKLIVLLCAFSKGFASRAAFGQPARGERRARLVHNRSPATRLGIWSADDGWGTRHGRAISGPAERRSDRRRGSAEPAVG